MSIEYPAVFYAQERGSVGVVFPDLPGCVTVGRDLREAILRAEEVLSLHLETMREDGDILPPPTRPVDRAQADTDMPVLGKLLIVPRAHRVVKVTITMDAALLARLDYAAAERGTTRSGLLAEGVRQLIEPA
jgi:predicted RNase H-like HicB family nuclease